jgi:hypothetical protein
MASGLYNAARAAFLKADIDWEAADVRCLLVDETYVFDATEVYVDDLVAYELGATDYARQTVDNRAVSGTSPTYADADNITFAGLGGVTNETINGAVLFVDTGDDATAPLICFVDLSDVLTEDIDTIVDFADGHVFDWTG